jgi:hypothetical protein
MNDAKWTVGSKSQFATHNPNLILDEKGDTVAQVFGVALHTTLEEAKKSERNREGLKIAHLIAAAPDLLTALKGLVEYVNGRGSLWEDARKAIAKAEGQ